MPHSRPSKEERGGVSDLEEAEGRVVCWEGVQHRLRFRCPRCGLVFASQLDVSTHDCEKAPRVTIKKKRAPRLLGLEKGKYIDETEQYDKIKGKKWVVC